MYHDAQGREIEDLEGEQMRSDVLERSWEHEALEPDPRLEHELHGGAAGSFRAEGCGLCPEDESPLEAMAAAFVPALDPTTGGHSYITPAMLVTPAMLERNPVLGLAGVRKLQALDPATRELLREALLELRVDANEKAEKSWAKRKGPMAAYWRAVSTYAGHFARSLR